MDHRKWTEEHIAALQNAITRLKIELFPIVILEIIELYIPEIRVINKTVELETNAIHQYETLKIVKGGILTTEAWDPKYNLKGGVLRIHCNSLILESGGCISVTGKGYKGGEKGGFQGYSYDKRSDPKPSRSANYGGGGGKLGYGWYHNFGGGGGYGTKGGDGTLSGGHCAKGGNTYGDKTLLIPIKKRRGRRNEKHMKSKSRSKPVMLQAHNSNLAIANSKKKVEIKYDLYLGSGGGSGGDYSVGGSGGGAIAIECRDRLILNENTSIQANGSSSGGGCGSGGSIYIKSPTIIINSKQTQNDKDSNSHSNGNNNNINNNRRSGIKIEAVGGKPSYGGKGGMGRIRIDCSKQSYKKHIKKLAKVNGAIQPKIGYTEFI